MSDVYDESYYINHCGPIPYQPEAQEWHNFFKHVAMQIDATLDVDTAIEVGCAFGHLVKYLNDLGIDTIGYENSDYAIERSLEPHKISKWNLLQKPMMIADLVICIEVVEHLFPEDAETAINNLCFMANKYILFSSSPDDFAEPTHHNVQSEEYWLTLFEDCGFRKCMDAPWLSKQAIILERL